MSKKLIPQILQGKEFFERKKCKLPISLLKLFKTILNLRFWQYSAVQGAQQSARRKIACTGMAISLEISG